MKQLLIPALLACLSASAQKEVFRSTQQFSQKQLEEYYASIRVHDSLLLFNAPDYTLYVYHTGTGKLLWQHYLGLKSNIAPFVAGGSIWANTNNDAAVRLSFNGKQLGTLPFGLDTEPFATDSILYTTGIYDGGSLIAWDLKGDSIRWKKFIAHGVSVTPYFLNDRILANAESNNWIAYDYRGNCLNPKCTKLSEEERLEESSAFSCAEPFAALTHDGRVVTSKLEAKLHLEERIPDDRILTRGATFYLEGGRLGMVGQKGKLHFSKLLYELSDSVEEDHYGKSALLRADEQYVWVLYNDKFITVDHKAKQVSGVMDLSQWTPHGVVYDGKAVWIVSKDGVVRGIEVKSQN